ncbi:MAG: DHA2 family efflux MFS transporter permease subunit [Desulfobacteraceae bacterium]|nr:DHA2 family efflux MFS transporter permease subunit [Desulfobacteraceae bacterium]
MSSTKPAANKWLITLTVMMATIMAALDISIVNVALPYMRGNLGASVEEITWVATGYLLSNVIIMPMIAMLTARFGRRSFYLFSILLFTLTSMLCGVAWNLSSLIFFRTLQGIGGGSIIPISQAILRESFPPEEQGKIIGIYGLGVILGPAFGPTLGGWLTDTYSWRWIFFINVPVGLLNLILITRYIHDPPYLVRDKGRLDYGGLAFLTVGLGCLQLFLEKGEQWDWFESEWIVWLAVLAAAGLVLFVWRELSCRKPAVDLRLFRDRSFATGTFLGGIFGIALYGSLFLLPLFLQEILGYTALNSGLTMMPRSLAMALTMPLAGRLYNRSGPRLLVGTGMLVSAFSFWQLSRLNLGVGYWDIFVPQALQGVGFGLVFVSITTSAMLTIEKSRMTAATGLYVVMRQIFGSIGIALVATELTRSQTRSHVILAEHLNPYRDIVGRWLAAGGKAFAAQGTAPSLLSDKSLHLLEAMTGRHAAMLAFNHVFFLLALLFIVSFPLTFLLQSKRGR